MFTEKKKGKKNICPAGRGSFLSQVKNGWGKIPS